MKLHKNAEVKVTLFDEVVLKGLYKRIVQYRHKNVLIFRVEQYNGNSKPIQYVFQDIIVTKPIRYKIYATVSNFSNN